MYAMMKATDYCNMGCRYCYVPSEQRRTKEQLPLETLPVIFRNMFEWQQSEESCGDLEMCWSGGEVLTLPPEWWEGMLSIQRKIHASGRYTFKLTNSMQTNLTLLDDQRFESLARHDVRIGTSLDGPKAVTDKTRLFKDGSSAFDVILGRMQHLRAKYQFVPGVIVVLSKANVGRLPEVFHFFNEMKMGFQINTYHYTPSSSARHPAHILSAKEYLAAMCELFDLWSERPDAVDVHNFRRVTEFLLYGKRDVCKMGPACANRFYMVRWNGDVYPCNEFAGAEFEKEFCYGNLLRQDWHAVRDHPTRQLLIHRPRLIRESPRRGNRCRHCRYWEGCHGGCLHSTLKGQYRRGVDCSAATVGSRSDTEECEKTYGLFAHAEKRMREKARQYHVPVWLYPDRVTPDKKKRRRMFYDYQQQLWQMWQIDPAQQPTELPPLPTRLLAACVRDARSVLHVCCGSGGLLRAVRHQKGPGVEVLGLDYRRPPAAPEADETIFAGEDLLQWEQWRSGPRWDVIFVAAEYVHSDDMEGLLSCCEPTLRPGGRIIVYATEAYLHQGKFLNIVSVPGVATFDPGAVAVTCGGLTYTVLSWQDGDSRAGDHGGNGESVPA